MTIQQQPRDGAQTIYSKDGGVLLLGQWDPRPLLKAVTGPDEGYWKGKRVLDIGANTFGLSIELARAGASVVAIEPDPFDWYFKLVRETVEKVIADEELPLSIHKDGLFEAGKYGSPFDCVLLLGVIYHFRDPQYLLDFLSTLDTKDIVISTQTADGDALHLVNRRGAIQNKDFWSDDIILSGWHPTRPLLERMLRWAGFDDVTALTDSSVNFPKKPLPGLTNSAYYRATKVGTVDPEESRKVYYPR